MRPPPRFTEEQKATLEARIHEYLSRDEKKELAKELKLGLDQVSNYLNRRRKEEKEKKKIVDMENKIKELQNELDQASTVNLKNRIKELENELQQANTVDLKNRIKELENELQQANDQISSLNETLGLWQRLQIAGL